MEKKKTSLRSLLRDMSTDEIRLYASMNDKQRKRFRILRASKIV